jgi:hypothetical protein
MIRGKDLKYYVKIVNESEDKPLSFRILLMDEASSKFMPLNSLENMTKKSTRIDLAKKKVEIPLPEFPSYLN